MCVDNWCASGSQDSIRNEMRLKMTKDVSDRQQNLANVKLVKEILDIHVDRQTTISHISEWIDISYGLIHLILTVDLNIRKLSARCNDCCQMMKWKSYDTRFLNTDKTWLFYHDPMTYRT